MDVTPEIMPLHRCLENSPCEKFPQALVDFDLWIMHSLAPLRDRVFLEWIHWLTNGLPGVALMILTVLLVWRASSAKSMSPKIILTKFPSILYVILCVGISDFSATLLKKYVGRIKPLAQLAASHVRLSFPSNHAFNCAVLASLSFVLLRPSLSHPKRYASLAFLFAAIVAFSRVYLWEHFPSDVFAGLLLGGIFGFIAGIPGRRIPSAFGHRIDG